MWICNTQWTKSIQLGWIWVGGQQNKDCSAAKTAAEVERGREKQPIKTLLKGTEVTQCEELTVAWENNEFDAKVSGFCRPYI